MSQLSRLLFLCLSVFSTVFSETVLVLTDGSNIQVTHSTFFSNIKRAGFELEFKAADDTSLVLMEYGVNVYSHVVIFAPNADEFGGDLSPVKIAEYKRLDKKFEGMFRNPSKIPIFLSFSVFSGFSVFSCFRFFMFSFFRVFRVFVFFAFSPLKTSFFHLFSTLTTAETCFSAWTPESLTPSERPLLNSESKLTPKAPT